MNCTVIQRRLLAAEQPDQPETDVRSHLDQCPACRAWQRRLVQMERHIPLLPVPQSSAKRELLQRILGPEPRETPPAAVEQRVALPRSPLAPGPKERALQKVSVAFALAAALLIFSFSWWVWPHNVGSPADSVALTRQQRDQLRLDARLTQALRSEAAQTRLLKLADLAEAVHGEASQMADNTEKLDQWARFYARVVSDHLLEQARQLPPADRPIVLKEVAFRLQQAESRASRLATRLRDEAPQSAASFEQIALAARQGEKDLLALMRS